MTFDLHVKRARLLHADPETLDFVPSWYGERLLALGEQRAARIGMSGPVDPGALDGIDPALAGRDQLPFLREASKVVNDRTTNWTIAPAPTPRVGGARPSRARRRTPRSRSCGRRSSTSCGSTPTTRSPRGASAPTRSSTRRRG